MEDKKSFDDKVADKIEQGISFEKAIIQVHEEEMIDILKRFENQPTMQENNKVSNVDVEKLLNELIEPKAVAYFQLVTYMKEKAVELKAAIQATQQPSISVDELEELAENHSEGWGQNDDKESFKAGFKAASNKAYTLADEKLLKLVDEIANPNAVAYFQLVQYMRDKAKLLQ